MPELPEVETTAQGLNLVIPEQTIMAMRIYDSRLRWPVDKSIIKKVQNTIIGTLTRRSKYLLMPVYDHDQLQGQLMIHLGMSGRLQVMPGSTLREKHSHIEWALSNEQHLRYTDPRRFGSVHWIEPDTLHPLLSKLGPEPLSTDFNGQYLFDKTRRRQTTIKVLIMNAHIVVGVGNIYASEALFRAGILPTTLASTITLDQAKLLAKHIKATLKAAIKAGGTTLRDFASSDGKPGYFQQKLNVYGREGEPCRVCGAKVQHLKIGQRATFFCEGCQG